MKLEELQQQEEWTNEIKSKELETYSKVKVIPVL